MATHVNEVVFIFYYFVQRVAGPFAGLGNTELRQGRTCPVGWESAFSFRKSSLASGCKFIRCISNTPFLLPVPHPVKTIGVCEFPYTKVVFKGMWCWTSCLRPGK